MTEVERFGFEVKRTPVKKRRGGRLVEAGEGWAVFLPHQCDTWDIAGAGEGADPFGRGVPLDEACAQLESFIAEATDALEALRQAREFGRG